MKILTIILNFFDAISNFNFCLLYNPMFYKRFLFKFNIVYEMGFINHGYNNISPKISTIVSDYIESEFINNIGLGIVISFLLYLLSIILLEKL